MTSGTTEFKLAERSALLAMAFAGGRLHETSDIRGRLGLKFTRFDRHNLIARGLIRSHRRSPKTLELTEDGWAWAYQEMMANKPSGVMGLGTLYSALADVRRVLDQRGENLRSFFDVKDPGASEATGAGAQGAQASLPEPSDRHSYEKRIGEAAWAEADNALALALQDMPSFLRTLDRSRSLSEADRQQKFEGALRQIQLAAEQVFQNVKRAASRRDLLAPHARGDIISFDAAAYESNGDIGQGDKSVVVKPAVTREVAGVVHVIARGIADPC